MAAVKEVEKVEEAMAVEVKVVVKATAATAVE